MISVVQPTSPTEGTDEPANKMRSNRGQPACWRNQVVLGARSELMLARRIEKGLRFATQLLRARAALKDCDRVGASARVAGRMRV